MARSWRARAAPEPHNPTKLPRGFPQHRPGGSRPGQDGDSCSTPGSMTPIHLANACPPGPQNPCPLSSPWDANSSLDVETQQRKQGTAFLMLGTWATHISTKASELLSAWDMGHPPTWVLSAQVLRDRRMHSQGLLAAPTKKDLPRFGAGPRARHALASGPPVCSYLESACLPDPRLPPRPSPTPSQPNISHNI